jgi:hypothetical protein
MPNILEKAALATGRPGYYFLILVAGGIGAVVAMFAAAALAGLVSGMMYFSTGKLEDPSGKLLGLLVLAAIAPGFLFAGGFCRRRLQRLIHAARQADETDTANSSPVPRD